ncbi:MAG TPA: carboxypeptidase regulatory-like domain-containing protein [Saprospiraceae bacterium]|nr:carboxypeptidase regulatory-like domain-containing protein [Saprospiraceae bacterium]
MRLYLLKKFFLSSMLFLGAIGLYAQGVTTSSIQGSIVDESGFPLPGANITAKHLPSGTSYGVVTNLEGRFIIPNMRVGGPYTVNVSFVGFEENQFEDIVLALGENFILNVVLKEGSVLLGEVVVSSLRDAVMNTDRTGASLNLKKDKINALPTISRSINDFTRLTPQSNGNAFAGTNSRFNNYTIDGNIYNNNFGLGAAQFAGGNPISLDAIEEVQVNLAPYDVRQAGFTGAGVNAITRSGTNNVEGSVYYYLRNDQMTGSKIGDTRINVGDAKTEIMGFRFGAPIIKDKLFVFVNYERENEATPSILRRAARPGETPDGQFISRVPIERANFVRERMQSLYGYDTGDPDSYQFAVQGERFNVRFDYNISNQHKLAVRFNHYDAFRDVPTNVNSIRYINTRYFNTSRIGVESINFRNNNYTIDNTISSVVAELNSVFGNNKSNQLNIGFTSITDPRRGVPGGQDFPMIEVLEPDASGNLLYYMTLGNELFTVGNLLENKIFNITNNFSIYSGKHTYTIGGNFEFMTFDNAFNPTFNGFYRYIGYDKFVDAVINRNPNVFPDAFAKGYALDGSTTPPTDNTRFGQLGLYVQDEYQVNNRLKLTAGLRVDLPFYPIDIPRNTLLDNLNKTFVDSRGNSFTPDVSTFPKVNPLFSPRFGFNYDVFGDRKTQLRGGSGIFSGRIPFVWLSNQVNGSGVIRGGVGFEGQQVINAGIIFNPDIAAYNPENPEGELSNELNLTDRNFRLPQVWRTNVGLDHRLPGGIIATVDIIYSRDVSTPIAYNPVLRDPDGVLTGADKRGYWETQPGLSAYSNDPNFRNVFLLTNAQEKADYYSFTAQLAKSFESGFYTMVAYTRSRARDLDAAGGSQAISLWPSTVQFDRNNPELSFAGFDQPNRLLGNFSYTSNNTTIGIFYDAGNAGRFSYSYSSGRPGTQPPFFGDGALRLMYIPNNASELTFEQFTLAGQTITPAMQQQLLDTYIDQDAYLSSRRGQIAERNGAVRPWVHRFDLRILQDIVILPKNNHRIQLSMDFLNFGNLLNSNWGIPKFEWQNNLLSLRSINAEGVPIYRLNTIPGTTEFPTETFRNSTSINNVWNLQVGVRYIF